MFSLTSFLTKEELLLLALLRDDYDQACLLLKSKNPSLKKVTSLFMKHWISPVMFMKIRDSLAVFFPEDVLSEMRSVILSQINRGKWQRLELIKAGQILHSNNIDFIVLKGPILDRDNKNLRVSFDLDIMVRENDLPRVIRVLQNEGYIYKGSFVLSRREKRDIEGQLSWNNQFQFTTPDSPVTLEVHSNLFERDRIRLENLDSLLNRVDLFWLNSSWNREWQGYVPCTEASLALLCLHCSLKRSPAENKFILRHLVDMETLFLRGIDRDHFLFLCRCWKIEYHISFAFSLYRGIMGFEKTEEAGLLGEILESRLTNRELRLRKIHWSCLRNLKRSSPAGQFLYRMFMPLALGGGFKKTALWYLTAIFPTRVMIENRFHSYGFRKESPLIFLAYFLNPFQWLWRKIKVFFYK